MTRAGWVLASAAGVALLAGCTAQATAVPDTPVTPPPAARLSAHAPTGQTAAAVLAALPVRPAAPMAGYSRAKFPHWSDLDHNGCDSRADTLARDALPGTVTRNRHGCVVGATVVDPYTGGQVTEAPGRGSDIDIDHVVALGNAWATGARQLTTAQRQKLANDPDELVAVDDDVNRDKSDQDASTWLPPDRGDWCRYVARQIRVKAKYGLWVTPAERDAMTRVLAACPGQKVR